MDGQKKKFSTTQILKFIVPSILGIMFLMFPFSYEGETTIAVALLAGKLVDALMDYIPTMVLILITITGVLTLVYKIWEPDVLKNNSFLKSICHASNFWIAIRLMGLVFVYMVYFNIGPEFVRSEDTGALILFDLICTLFTMFLFAGFFLPLLTDFGLLEFVGAMLTRVMRPLFGLPGRSSIDCIASWVGDGTIGVALTNKQYIQGYYTTKEAAVIATTFSAVSITFCLVVLSQVDLVYLFAPYYLTILVAGIVAALILPRIPPLSKKKDTYYKGVKKDLGEDIPEGYTSRTWGLELAVKKAEENFDLRNFINNGVKTVLDMWLGVLPSIMAFGTLGLIIAEYTPIFEILGKPFIPIYQFFNIEYAVEASKTVMVGFADMFIPSVIGATIPSAMTRFIVATLSVTQLVYLSEAGSVILGSKIDIGFLDLFIIYIERTLVTLPIIIAAAYLIF
ncbi:nucleoside recognition GATE domain-containing membrane protein YjiH [Anaerosphaera aminiphila DSM 21120]|uniref:Nucleoside recognition GATE domain-containing membrane protein YjiH n=1 Tax=Anaerosphaera aminiphila DSM 21120 TaxID=1120995 RepID=A0A1M5R0Z5_9FIRM|nr:YjiH family protein [Anaerosphaera aminiphila]SHH19838.1 nucleoside recognition GATE domain-containing membrane protein YjiH [Anaerosphaera aminiphila DSM 21120]